MLSCFEEQHQESFSSVSENSVNSESVVSSAQSDYDSNLIESAHSFHSQKSVESSVEEKVNQSMIGKRISFEHISKAKIQLTWKNITITSMPKKRCFKIDPNSRPLTILDDVSGTVKPGEFLSIIGASGAGKTTLLNFLSGKDPSRNLKKLGEVQINGINRNKVNFNSFVGYVQQDDVLLKTLTVRECLMFAAKLKLPPSENHEEKVDMLIEFLKLERASNMRISQVIGGERKCTSIGVELITDPSLIFLDEPTTGMDSFTAHTIVQVMAALSRAGRTVICTIHQPSSEIYASFDKLMLMAQGQTIYLNKAHFAVEYFSKIGYPCPEHSNPADYFMEIMSIETLEMDDENQELLNKHKSQIEEDLHRKIIEMHNKYEGSELKCDVDDTHPEASKADLSSSETHYRAPFCKQFWILLVRGFKEIYRNPQASYLLFITNICKN